MPPNSYRPKSTAVSYPSGGRRMSSTPHRSPSATPLSGAICRRRVGSREAPEATWSWSSVLGSLLQQEDVLIPVL